MTYLRNLFSDKKKNVFFFFSPKNPDYHRSFTNLFFTRDISNRDITTLNRLCLGRAVSEIVSIKRIDIICDFDSNR